MLDSESERVEAGWLLEEHSHGLENGNDAGDSTLSSPDKLPTNGLPLWDYIDMYHRRSPMFHNFMFSPYDQDIVSAACL